MRSRDDWFSRELRFALGYDEDSARHYVSIPVTTGIFDYEEFYAVDDVRYFEYLADPELALPFVVECRQRLHDDLLLIKPGKNRGVAS